MQIALSGLGRAGRALVEYVDTQSDDSLFMAVCREGSAGAGSTVGAVLGMTGLDNVPVVEISQAKQGAYRNNVECLVDFSHKDFTPELLDLCLAQGWNLVICTTNHEEEALSQMRERALDGGIGVVYAPNLTLGVNMLMEFARRLSRVFPDFDFAIVERHRIDKPPVSATAKMIASSVEGKDVPIAHVRAGGYVGIHELTAANERERITIEHESFTRAAFAAGAMEAARFLSGKRGFFHMSDVISGLDQEGCQPK